MSNQSVKHYGTKGMRWGVRKDKSHSSYMQKEKAYEYLNIGEGKRLPKNWKKQMADIDEKNDNYIKAVKAVSSALIIIGGASMIAARKGY